MQWNFLVSREFPSFLKAEFNGDSLGCVLRGSAEHAVVMIDKTERGHTDTPHSAVAFPTDISNWKAVASEFKYAAL